MAAASFIFTIEKAKSGRAKCKGCGDVIAKNALRVGIRMDLGSGGEENENPTARHMAEAPKWYHMRAECVQQFRKTPNWWNSNCPSVDDFEGVEDINDSEGDVKALISELLEEVKNNVKNGVKSGVKRKSEPSSENDSPKKAKTAPSPPAEYSAPYLDDAKQQEIKDKIAELRTKNNTVSQLRSLLKANEQRQVGKKDELVERVAECMIIGTLPKCPMCSRRPGLKLDRQTGEITCAGGLENGQMIRCQFKSDSVDMVPFKSVED